jgi:hypothetical protein
MAMHPLSACEITSLPWKNVLGGSHDFLEVSGDAFHVSISLDGVSIASLWDDDVEPTTIPLDQFIELMSR